MDEFVKVIQFTYDMLASNSLTFGNFSFSLLAVPVSFAIIGLVGWFFGSLFKSQ